MVGANLVFALVAINKAVWRREKGEHKVHPCNDWVGNDYGWEAAAHD